MAYFIVPTDAVDNLPAADNLPVTEKTKILREILDYLDRNEKIKISLGLDRFTYIAGEMIIRDMNRNNMGGEEHSGLSKLETQHEPDAVTADMMGDIHNLTARLRAISNRSKHADMKSDLDDRDFYS